VAAEKTLDSPAPAYFHWNVFRMWQSLKAAWRRAQEQAQMARSSPISAEHNPAVAAYRDEVLARFPYTNEARAWLRAQIGFEVQDLSHTRGGGFWYPGENKVFLYSAQYEAAIHELAHAWWHYRREGQEDAMIETTIRLSEEHDPRYERMQKLAYGYIHGIAAQNWPGMLVDRNDWEMYAGLASGIMADMRLVPLYVRPFYDGMYLLLPEDAPSPAAQAPHN
jgi:hypothetical protein